MGDWRVKNSLVAKLQVREDNSVRIAVIMEFKA